ncbi:MAG: carboxymuconolactone decarboxylase family protein [Bacteroidales bacterium]|nr:carboxymuconolactone decarboxylase family protein [Bacteroidales bacterium]
MIKNKEIDTPVTSRKSFKRKFSFLELYQSLSFAPQAVSRLAKNNRLALVSKDFIKRLQLAVTEVNGCPACSYQHTKIALEQGMSNEEITSFLSGGDQFIKPEEAKAIMFAQHFADSRGFPKKYAYDALVEEYGEEKSKIIISAAQIMISGNIYGIPFSAFESRLKGHKYEDSNLFYELSMLIGGILIMPLAIIHGLIRYIFNKSNMRLDSSLEAENNQ